MLWWAGMTLSSWASWLRMLPLSFVGWWVIYCFVFTILIYWQFVSLTYTGFLSWFTLCRLSLFLHFYCVCVLGICVVLFFFVLLNGETWVANLNALYEYVSFNKIQWQLVANVCNFISSKRWNTQHNNRMDADSKQIYLRQTRNCEFHRSLSKFMWTVETS